MEKGKFNVRSKISWVSSLNIELLFDIRKTLRVKTLEEIVNKFYAASFKNSEVATLEIS